MDIDLLPVSRNDLEKRKWDGLDVILITGDAYADHPSFGVAVIGRVLENAGYRTGIIAQPDWKDTKDFMKLGRPRLFFGITAGNLDSMVANYTSHKRPRERDEYSPAAKTGLRPDRATIVYSNRIRESFSGVPIVIGGIEASLRRFAHYDWWDNTVRRSILLDSRADILVYGMGEIQVLEIAKRLSQKQSIDGICGTALLKKIIDKNVIELPAYEEVNTNKVLFSDAFKIIYDNRDPFSAQTLAQKHGNRYVIQYPPQFPPSVNELDKIYELPFTRKIHPVYDFSGGIPAVETVRFSIVAHRGCCGECSFCSISMHQGRIIRSRSQRSILKEARWISRQQNFRGTITDIGGPTVNLYQASCHKWEKTGACTNRHCLTPEKCPSLKLAYDKAMTLYTAVQSLPRIKHVFLGSGFRHDLLISKDAIPYLTGICMNHISGRMKIAPEHIVDRVLTIMNKATHHTYEKFLRIFRQINEKINKDQYIVSYFMGSHPGSTVEDAAALSRYLQKRRMKPEQVQDFIPLPMTISGCIHYTGIHPLTGEKIYVPATFRERKRHRSLIQYWISAQKKHRGP